MTDNTHTECHELKTGAFHCQEVHIYELEPRKLYLYLKSNQTKFPAVFSNLNIALNFKHIEFKSDEDMEEALKCYIEYLIALGHNVIGTTGIKSSISKRLNVQPLKEKKRETPSLLSGNINPTEKQDVKQSHCEQEISTRIINGVVRGGQEIHAENENLLIIGSVKHGAVVSAAGSITIFGELEGRAYAGTKFKDSFLMATKFNAELISVCSVYITNAKTSEDHFNKTTLVTVDKESKRLIFTGGK